MGNSAQKSPYQRAVQEQQVSILYQDELGKVTQQINGQTQYIIRELSFTNQAALNKSLAKIKHLQANPHPNLTSLLCIEQDTSTKMCGSEFRLRLIFQYSVFSISDEIQARKECSELQYFDLVDSCRMIIGCVRALGRIQEQIQNLGELSQTGLYHRVFVSPGRLLIMPDGVIKVVSPLIVSPYDRYHHKRYCYYSPQKLADFDYPQDQKSAIFQLGITFIHLLTLQSCQNIYNGFEVKQDQIDKKILRIWQIYRNTSICEIISKMTRIFRNFRLSLKQCIEQVDMLEMKMLNQFTNPPLSSKCKNNRQFNTFNKMNNQSRNYLMKICEENESNKQNVFNSSNMVGQTNQDPNFKLISSLFTRKEQNPSRQPGNKKKNLGCKQSYCVTPSEPFNIEMIVSNNFSLQGKQSYCYGNQLAQGIIPNNRQCNKFQRKRTRFNKKID